MRICVRQRPAYHQGIFPALGKLGAACQHHAELLGCRYRRNHIVIRVHNCDRLARAAAHVRGVEKRLSAARETLCHARRTDHEHRTARNGRLAIVVKRAIAIVRRAVDEHHAARDLHAAVAVDGISRRVEHERSAVDLDKAVGRTCAGGTTLIASTLGRATLAALGSVALAASLLGGPSFTLHASLVTPRCVTLGRFALRGAVPSLLLALPLGTALWNLATQSTLATAGEATAIRRTSTRRWPAFSWRFSIDSNTVLARSATIISFLVIGRAIREVGSA